MAYLKIPGIYEISCEASGKTYVGSAVSIHRRWATHRSLLRRGRHTNRHLQNAWDKHGEASFKFQIIELCAVPALAEREQHWIDAKRAADPRFGMNNSPTASTSIGFRHSESTKKLLSSLAAARDNSHLQRHAEACRGKPSPNRGKPGQKWTQEQRAKASEQRKGRTPWNVGVPVADSVKQKISKWWADNAASDPVRQRVCELRAGGMVYTAIAKVVGLSVAQVHRYSRHVPVSPRQGLRTYEKKQGVA